jgi:hypothetical protein
MPKEPSAPSVALRGRVTSFNVSPKGDLEGVLLQLRDGVAQLNFAKGAHEVAERWAIGSNVVLRGVLEEEGFAHPVYRLEPEETSVRGKVARLNFARHGEPNGFVLEDGTFVHQKPDGAKKQRVRVGDRVRATGEVRVGRAATVLEATSVTREATAKAPRSETGADA